MTTNVKSSATSRKGRSNRVNSASVNVASVSISAPAGAGSTAGGVAPISSGAAVPAAHKSAKENTNDKLAAALALGGGVDDVKVVALRSAIASHFSTPEWSGAAAVRAALAGLGLNDEQVNAAVAAAARKSGVDLSAPAVSVARVLTVIRRYYRREFEQVCGCSFATAINFYRSACLPAGSAGFSWSLSLPLSLVVAGSAAADFVSTVSLPAGSSAAAVIAGVLSFRNYVAFRRSLAVAMSGARRDIINRLELVVRDAQRLGLTSDWLAGVTSSLWSSVPAADDVETRRMLRSLGTQQKRLNSFNYRLMCACPAVCEVDTSGDFFVPASAVLPAGAGRAAGRLFAGRARVLSNIATLRGLLALGC